MDKIFDFDYSWTREDVIRYFEGQNKEELIAFAKNNNIRLFSSKEDKIRDTVSTITYSRLHKGDAFRI